VEWMIRSAEYAREVIRVARTEQHADLLKLADKLEAALDVGAKPVARNAAPPARRPSFAHSESADSSSYPASDYPASGFDGAAPAAGAKRYVRSLR